MTARLATVFGGTGFIGRHVVQHLLAEGFRVRVAGRDPEAAAFLKPLGDVGQVVAVAADITDDASVAAAVQDAQWVVNAVGILIERRRGDFQTIHVEAADRVARAAAAAGVDALVHLSAIGASAAAEAAYARSKAAGETRVFEAFPNATILRPSVVFGPEDDFFNRFAEMSSFSPVLPVFVSDGSCRPSAARPGECPAFGSGGTKLQPVYVGDVAAAVVVAGNSPASRGRIYELGGPTVYSLKQLLELVLKATGRRRLLLPLPLFVARWQAAFLQYLPNPPLTPDQVKLLATDNVVSEGALGLADLGIEAKACEAIVTDYLGRFRNAYAPAD